MPENRHERAGAEHFFLLGHNEHTPLHAHDRGHLVYPASGVLAMVTARGSWIAPPNRAVWIPAGSDHEHRTHGITDMRVFFMAPRQAALLPDHPAVLAMTPLAREATLALTDPASTGRGQRTAAARTRLRRVIIDELAAAPEQPLHLPEPADDRLQAIARLLDADPGNHATLAELGRHVGAGERTLSRLFRLETGMSFPQWRTQLRIHRALLLLSRGASVTSTATACGWSNPSAFIETFTGLVGQTPGRYQRSVAGGGG